MNNKTLIEIIKESLAIEERDAREAGALGYMARALVQATLPHKNIPGNEFKRRNGNFKLTILTDSEIGLPYGSIPRLLIAWITTEVVRNKERQIILGDNLTEFMYKLDMVPTGGRWGTITRLKNQMTKLFSSHISCSYDDGQQWVMKNVTPVSQANLWWEPKNPSQAALFESRLVLGEDFFNEIINCPIPINMDALKLLKKSPMALDIYCWLTYRTSYLKKKSIIPWPTLKMQFGADYKRERDFKRHFIEQLKKVVLIYPEANIQETEKGLTIGKGETHIQKL